METDYKKLIEKLIKKENTPNPRATLAGNIGVNENYLYKIMTDRCDISPKVKRVLDGMVEQCPALKNY